MVNLVNKRLLNQGLVYKNFSNPSEVVGYLGAVQAQDFPAAKYSLGVRMKDSTDAKIEKDFNDGKILRTHVMRPTWHFVLPEDIVWMEQLTSSRVKAQMASYNRKLELTDAVFEKTTKLIIKLLEGNNFLNRQEIKKEFQKIGVETNVQKLAHLIMWPELDGLICSGPKLGKQLTYALVKERAPQAKSLNREESLAKLTLKYFSSHGPAQAIDFSWWSGLNKKEIAEGLELNKNKLQSATIDGKINWFSEKAEIKNIEKAQLLSIYDEYTIAYRDRSALGAERYMEKLLSLGNWLTAVVIINGELVGTWKRVIKKATIEVKINTFQKLNNREKELVEEAVEAYGKFMEVPIIIESIERFSK